MPKRGPKGGTIDIDDPAEEKLARYRKALELIAYPDSRDMALLEEASEAAREALDA